MNSNSTSASNRCVVVDREIASGTIEGVDFGPRVWVVARSPDAVLMWKFASSSSVNGHRLYSEPGLYLLADRTPRFMYHPTYKRLGHIGPRFKADHIPANDLVKIGGALDIRMGEGIYLERAMSDRKTLLVDGGGNQLLPAGLYGPAYRAWMAQPDHGFIMLPPGVTMHEACRHKLGWAPK
jgi:hypothetical protein